MFVQGTKDTDKYDDFLATEPESTNQPYDCAVWTALQTEDTGRHEANQGPSPARVIGGPHQRAQVNHGRQKSAKRRGRRQLRTGAGVGDQGQARKACSLRAEVHTEASEPSRVAQEPLSSAALRPSGMLAGVQVPGPDVRPRLLGWTRVCLLKPEMTLQSSMRKRGRKSEVALSCPTPRPHGLWPTRLLHPRDSPGKSTGVGCHFLLQGSSRPREQMQVSCLASTHFTTWAPREVRSVRTIIWRLYWGEQHDQI